MSDTARHLSWENFELMIRRGVPALHRVSGEPVVDMFVDEKARRIGLRTPCPDETEIPPSPLAAIQLDLVWVGGTLLEVATAERRLYPEFYSFCVSLADRIQLEHQPAVQAVPAALSNWQDLLRPVSQLPLERQLGLVGELWLLFRLIVAEGAAAVHSWTGPLGEPHDFRLGDSEFEVKVTLAPTRSHMINGEQQLVPSPDHGLWIVSLQLEPAGTGGISLPELVDALRDRLGRATPSAGHFDTALVRSGFHDADRALYDDRWQFRSNPRLVPVNESCPRITRASLEESNATLSHRISEVHYRINLEGMGLPNSSEEFQQALPIGEAGLDVRG